MSEQAILRQALRSDCDGIWRVRHAVRENTLTPGRISNDELIERLETRGRGWVMELAGEVAAFAIGCSDHSGSDRGRIWALFVHPDHAAKGYGRRLHDATLAWLWSQGLERLWLTTGLGTRAETFYRLCGWVDCGPTDKGELRFEMPRPTIVILNQTA